MRKFSYVLILCGILVILYPQANEWYNDRQQQKLLEQAEQNFNDSSTSAQAAELESRYAQVSQLLAEESTLDEQAQTEGESPAPVEPEISGNVIALIQISKIDLMLPVLEGATKTNMKHAAAHMKETTPLGEIGNAAIAAHRARTTGRLFNRLNEVAIGDIITVKTKEQTYNYEVYEITVVKPTDLSVLKGNGKDKMLTLITCDPLVNPTHRLIVHARLP